MAMFLARACDSCSGSVATGRHRGDGSMLAMQEQPTDAAVHHTPAKRVAEQRHLIITLYSLDIQPTEGN